MWNRVPYGFSNRVSVKPKSHDVRSTLSHRFVFSGSSLFVALYFVNKNSKRTLSNSLFNNGIISFVVIISFIVKVTNPVLTILTQKCSIRFRDFNDFRDFQDFKDFKDFQDLWVKSERFCVTF